MSEAEDKKIVLIAIFDNEMRHTLAKAFQEDECPFKFKVATTIDEAAQALSQNIIHAIVMTRTEALSGDNGLNGLVATQSKLPPTVTIIKKGDDYPNYCYPPYENNDWVTTPFSLPELYVRISGVIKRANK